MRGKLYIVDRDYHDYAASVKILSEKQSRPLPYASIVASEDLQNLPGRLGYARHRGPAVGAGWQRRRWRIWRPAACGPEREWTRQPESGPGRPRGSRNAGGHPAARIGRRSRHEHHRRAAAQSLFDSSPQRSRWRKLRDHQRDRRQFSFSIGRPRELRAHGRTDRLRPRNSQHPWRADPGRSKSFREKNTSGIELKLTPQSVIAGHVFDEDGDPVQSVNIEVWRYTYPRGRRQLTQAQNGSTNDLGEFRISNLSPGRYYVSATARRGALPAILNTGRPRRAWWPPDRGRWARRTVGGYRGLRHHLLPELDRANGRIAARSSRWQRGPGNRYPFAESALSPHCRIGGWSSSTGSRGGHREPERQGSRGNGLARGGPGIILSAGSAQRRR